MSNKAMVFPDSLSSRGRSTERVKIFTFLLALMICVILACLQPPHQYLKCCIDGLLEGGEDEQQGYGAPGLPVLRREEH